MHLGGVDRAVFRRMAPLLGGVSPDLKLLIGGFYKACLDTMGVQASSGSWLFGGLIDNNGLPTPQQQHGEPGHYSRQTFVNGVMPLQIAP